jgi:hypothetical protein
MRIERFLLMKQALMTFIMIGLTQSSYAIDSETVVKNTILAQRKTAEFGKNLFCAANNGVAVDLGIIYVGLSAAADIAASGLSVAFAGATTSVDDSKKYDASYVLPFLSRICYKYAESMATNQEAKRIFSEAHANATKSRSVVAGN